MKFKVVDDNIFEEASAFVDECKVMIIGDSFGPAQCISDSECLTQCSLVFFLMKILDLKIKITCEWTFIFSIIINDF